MARKSKRVAKNALGTGQTVNYIAVPTQALLEHYQAINRLTTNFDPYHTPIDIPKVKKDIDWIEDKKGIVQKTIELRKLQNPQEFSVEDYKKPFPRWYSNGYKLKLRETIATSIFQCKTKRRYKKVRRYFHVEQSPQSFAGPKEFRVVYF